MTNVFVALEEGIRIFNAAIGGIWAAPDMPNGSLDCPTEDLVVMFEEMRIITDIELKKLSSCIDLAEEIAGRKLRK